MPSLLVVKQILNLHYNTAMDRDIVEPLKSGKVGILPTDTIYGLVGSALIPKAVESIYQLKKRDLNKPMIILISSLDDLKIFNVQISDKTRKYLQNIWPNPVSVVLPSPDKNLSYLHRGTKTLAFRMPNKRDLLQLLEKSGPLVAPSANVEGQKEAETIEEAKEYFGDQVAFYEDAGKLSSPPSTLVKIDNHQIIILRQGAYKLPELKL